MIEPLTPELRCAECGRAIAPVGWYHTDSQTSAEQDHFAHLTRPAASRGDEGLREALLDEMSPEWTTVERAIWPEGPAHGSGSGAYAALKARIIAALDAEEERG